jgi:4-carboxymuconolactone decarboxylase
MTMPYSPGFYMDFKKRFPEVVEANDVLVDRCSKQGPLDKKSQYLIKLGISIGINSESAVSQYARLALQEKTSVDELRHAVLMAATIAGLPATLAAMNWVEEVIKQTK